MLDLFPAGFEEREAEGRVELVAYTDAAGERQMRAAFGSVRAGAVEDGWEDRWREFHRGSLVGPVWIGPPWAPAPAGVDAVVIEPGQAFGTGSHPTTRLCVELLAGLPRTALLDAGCGSGVLAIAAARVGFAPVHAVDLDPLAVEAAARNAEANDVGVTVDRVDVLSDQLPEVPTTVANLTLAGVTAIAGRLPLTTLVSSGYLASDALELGPRRRLDRRQLDGWAADVWAPCGQ